MIVDAPTASTFFAFTFQSGYIQIFHTNKSRRTHNCLYIPIWLYSNSSCLNTAVSPFCFTFQSGYIQMSITSKPLTSSSIFTFQSGYIQMLTACASV